MHPHIFCRWVLYFHLSWNGSRWISLFNWASDSGSTCDNWSNPSASTKQISSSFGSLKMMTRTDALPGVSNTVNGWITFSLSFVIFSFSSVWSPYAMANAMRPNAVFRSIFSSERKQMRIRAWFLGNLKIFSRKYEGFSGTIFGFLGEIFGFSRIQGQLYEFWGKLSKYSNGFMKKKLNFTSPIKCQFSLLAVVGKNDLLLLFIHDSYTKDISPVFFRFF